MHQTFQLIQGFSLRCTSHAVLVAIVTAILLTQHSAAYANKEASKVQAAALNDVRVLIDISGSMKKNDPANLRQPALRLFISLLPSNTQAGVWTFGQWVNMLIPHDGVTREWKDKANKSISKVNSAGLFTNIEDVIRRSTEDWIHTTSPTKRSLVLLTDGIVDISEDVEKNHSSRQRILQELVPLLQKANVTIHAIALSEESDRNLLEQLATATGGRFETIDTTEGLERLFLHLFENVAPRDSLPLTNNRVKVDDSINEMTFLIFKGNSGEPASITSPSNIKYDANNHKDDGIIWHSDKNYDLVTIKKPESGYWKINSKLDPDNRVMVVTDLKLITTKLPSALLSGGSQPFYIHLENNGEIIDRHDFLHFVNATINQTEVSEKTLDKSWQLKLLDNGKGVDKKANDGIYSANLNKSLVAGEHEIEVVINGTTFSRNSMQQINIFDAPATASIETTSPKKFKVSVLPYQSLIDVNAINVTTTHTLPNGETNKIEMPRVNPSEWATEYSIDGAPGKHEIIINITGKDYNGKPIDATLPSLIMTTNEETISTNNEVENETDKDKTNNKPDSAIDEEAINWTMVTLRVITFNLMLIIICFALYKLWPHVRHKIISNTLEDATHG
jgi:uncharacterized protein (TIGR03503 family)